MLITNNDDTHALTFSSQFILTCSSTTLIISLPECIVSMKSMKLWSPLLTTPSSEDADITLSDRLYAWDTLKLGLLYTLEDEGLLSGPLDSLIHDSVLTKVTGYDTDMSQN